MSVQKVDKTTGNTTLIAGSTLWADSPIGTILAYGGATAPSGWFICQGQAISRTTYSELFAVIGTSFGTGDGSTTFNLPDLREATTKGVGLTGKSNNHYDSDGVALGEFIEDRMQNVAIINRWNTSSGGSGIMGTDNNTGNQHTVDLSTAAGSSARLGATTEVKAVSMYWIIKAKMVAMPSDFMSKVDEAVEEAMTDIGTVITNTADAHPTTTGEFEICSVELSAGTWLINVFSEINVPASQGDIYNNIISSSNHGNRTVRTVALNGGGNTATRVIEVTTRETITAKGYGYEFLINNAAAKQHSIIECIRIK